MNKQVQLLQLQVNNSGAWKTVLRYDGNDTEADRCARSGVDFLHAADAGNSKWRIATCEPVPRALYELSTRRHGRHLAAGGSDRAMSNAQPHSAPESGKRCRIAGSRASDRGESADMNDFDGPVGADRGVVAMSVPQPLFRRAYGPISPPTDLMEFLRDGSVRRAAGALRLSLGVVHQLRTGYWPDDPRHIMRVWSEYKGRVGRIDSSWFLRRVQPGGTIRHAGREWTGVGLLQCVGELVAVARMPDGALLAQTLEMPAQRLPLEPRS